MSRSRKNNRGPEYKFYGTLLGKVVEINLSTNPGNRLTATLLQVDRYSLILRAEDGDEFLLNKRSIETIGQAPIQ